MKTTATNCCITGEAPFFLFTYSFQLVKIQGFEYNLFHLILYLINLQTKCLQKPDWLVIEKEPDNVSLHPLVLDISVICTAFWWKTYLRQLCAYYYGKNLNISCNTSKFITAHILDSLWLPKLFQNAWKNWMTFLSPNFTHNFKSPFYLKINKIVENKSS